MQKVTANIHLKNIFENALAFKALTGTKLCAVVKANAYGHGAEEVVNAIEGVADCFAVALIEEGLSIQTAACGKDVLVFTPPLNEEECLYCLKSGLLVTVPDLFTARLVLRTCRKYRLRARTHLKINTGMNRYGMNVSTLGKVCTLFRLEEQIKVEGIYSHLYSTERPLADKQRKEFARAVEVCRRYFPSVCAHLGGTTAALLGKEFHFDMTRIGIGLYGYFPNGQLEGKTPLKLRKGMTVYATTVTNRKYSRGGVGYGKLPVEPPKEISVCRFGYADGFLRKRENGVCGAEKQVNNLCMDVCLRSGHSRRGQTVVVMADAEDTAKMTGTISYEVLCAATRRAEFVYDYE